MQTTNYNVNLVDIKFCTIAEWTIILLTQQAHIQEKSIYKTSQVHKSLHTLTRLLEVVKVQQRVASQSPYCPYHVSSLWAWI